MRFGPSLVTVEHPDFAELNRIRDGILRRLDTGKSLGELLPGLIKDAVDFVLDPVRTGRTQMAELDRVEKTFIGLKIEHFLRDLLDVPRGIKRDMQIDGIDVDIKNTVSSNWMIPPETYTASEPCLLIATAKFDGRCWLGLMVAREAYLNPGSNRDRKRSVSESGKCNILWLVEGVPYPPSSWDGIDMARFRDLRRVHPGKQRAAMFFRENLNRKVHRPIVKALLHDQEDYMKRLRGKTAAHGIFLSTKASPCSRAPSTKSKRGCAASSWQATSGLRCRRLPGLEATPRSAATHPAASLRAGSALRLAWTRAR
jgi:Restriction endonuclease NaeI